MAMIEAEPLVSGATGNRVVLEGVSWETYEKLIKGIGDGHARVTYDSGLMEIEMSPSRKHESDAEFLRSLVVMICSLKNRPVGLGGSTTHNRKDLAKGVEPDGCYWIANESKIRGVADLDLLKHPAPDLVIEVELTSRSVDKLGVYGALGVPEIWHVRPTGEIAFLGLDAATGSYTPLDLSISFPELKREDVQESLESIAKEGEILALNRMLSKLGLR